MPGEEKAGLDSSKTKTVVKKQLRRLILYRPTFLRFSPQAICVRFDTVSVCIQ